MDVLAGDIGGTKVLLQVVHRDSGKNNVVAEQRYDSHAYPGLTPMVQDFLQSARLPAPPRAACFGIAGPITPTAAGQSAKVTNLPWEVNSAELAREFKIEKLKLINDFQAVGYGIEALSAEDLVTLQAGTAAPRAPRAIIGAGTGLGQGILVWQQDHYETIATEGGHADFAPADAWQLGLLQYLRQRHEHVSYERVVSGQGLANIYSYLRDSASQSILIKKDLLASSDPAAAISFAAGSGDPLASQALGHFVDIYGAQAGNLALTAGATGGVYIAGGIAAKIIDRLASGNFMRAFLNKGRMSVVLEKIPVQVVMNPKVGLIGAALAACRL